MSCPHVLRKTVSAFEFFYLLMVLSFRLNFEYFQLKIVEVKILMKMKLVVCCSKFLVSFGQNWGELDLAPIFQISILALSIWYLVNIYVPPHFFNIINDYWLFKSNLVHRYLIKIENITFQDNLILVHILISKSWKLISE